MNFFYKMTLVTVVIIIAIVVSVSSLNYINDNLVIIKDDGGAVDDHHSYSVHDIHDNVFGVFLVTKIEKTNPILQDIGQTIYYRITFFSYLQYDNFSFTNTVENQTPLFFEVSKETLSDMKSFLKHIYITDCIK